MQRLLLLIATVLALTFVYSPKSSPLEADGHNWQDFESAVYGGLVPLIPTPQPVPTP